MTEKEIPIEQKEEIEEKEAFSFSALREKAISFYLLFVKTVFTLVILAALYNVLSNFNDHKLRFNAFDVPISLKERGYTGKEIARRISDRVNHIRNDVKSHIKIYKTLNTNEDDDIPEFEVPGSDMSLNAVIAYMRMFFGQEPQSVSGSIVESKQLNMIIRISGYPSETFVGKKKNIEQLISQAAEHVLMHLEPFSLALYYKEKKDIPALMKMIKEINSSSTSEQDKISIHIISSFVFSLQNNHNDAEKSAEKAVLLDSNHSYALHNYSLALVDTNQLEKSIEVMRRLVRVYPDWSTHNNIAYVLMMLGKHQKAIKEIKISLKMRGAKYDQCYDTWASILNDQGEYNQAIEKLHKAMEYAMPSEFDYYYHFLASMHAKDGNPEKAIVFYQQVLDNYPKSSFTKQSRQEIKKLSTQKNKEG